MAAMLVISLDIFGGRRPDALRVLLSAHMDTLVSGVDIEPIIENGIIKP
ncbi:hypothetical protein HKBW3S34_01838, partial [Candidatus Hakubella thermalkaliphila]